MATMKTNNRSNRLFTLETKILRFNNAVTREKTSCRIIPVQDFDVSGAGAYTKMNNLEIVLPLQTKVKDDGRTVVDAKAIWGTDYHEISHVMFSLPPGSASYQLQKFGQVATLAEENRVESLFITMFPGAKDILGYGVQAAITPDLSALDQVSSTDDVNTVDYDLMSSVVWQYYMFALRSWVLGSDYKRLRKTAIQVWGMDNVTTLDKLLMAYAGLSKKALGSAAPKILKKIQQLLPAQNHDAGNGSGCGCPSPGAGDGSGDTQSQSGSGGNGSDNAGKSDFDDTDVAQDYQEQAEASGVADEDSEQSSGVNQDEATPSVPEEVLEADGEQATREGGDEIRPGYHKNSHSAGYGWGGELQVVTMPITDEDHKQKMKLTRKLEEIEDDSSPTYIKGLPAGSVNIREWMKPNRDYTTMFQQYEPGRDDTSEMEVVCLTDVSGSMQGNEQDQARNVWIIGNAVEEASDNSRLTWLAFDEETHPIYLPDQKFSPLQVETPMARGGTDPSSTLAVTEQIFTNSDLSRKILFMLTDGAWMNEGESVRKLRQIKDANPGIVTVLVSYGYQVSSRITDCFDLYLSTDDMNDFQKFGSKVVAAVAAGDGV